MAVTPQPGVPGEPAFNQLLDTQTGQIFTLGDSKDKVNAEYSELNDSEPIFDNTDGRREWYDYSDDMQIVFLNGEVISLGVAYTTSRFVFGALPTDDLTDWFPALENQMYLRWFDAHGSVIVLAEDFDPMASGGANPQGAVYLAEAMRNFGGREDIVAIRIGRIVALESQE